MTTTDPLDFTLLMRPLARSPGAETARMIDVAYIFLMVVVWLDDDND